MNHQTFLDYLVRNKTFLLKAWEEKAREISPVFKELEPNRFIESASAFFHAFCRAIENKEDFDQLRQLIENMISERCFPGMSFIESQQTFSALRYVLFPFVIESYQGNDLLAALSVVNQAIDTVIFCFSDNFQRRHSEKLKNYANELKEEVRKRTSELEESQGNYQILFEEITDGCFVNQGGKIVFANKAFCEMHGYEREEMIGMQCEKLIAEDSRDKVMERFYQHLKGNNPFEKYIYCRQDKHGQCFPTENRVKLIRYKGKPAVLGLCTDITERLEMEEKIRQKDRLAIIGSLTTSLAHEIRNPLSAIQVNIQVLLERLNLNGNDLRRMQIAYEQSVQLENIVSQMMDFARPINLNYSLIDFADVIDQTLQLFEQEMSKNNISLVKHIDRKLPKCMADKEKILEAVSNIFKNALESFNRIQTTRQIEVRADTKVLDANRFVRVSIRDNGTGISKKDMKRIFEPFYTKGKKGGIGLGLSIFKKIIDAHDGRIQVESDEGKGTSFTFMIPVEISK